MTTGHVASDAGGASRKPLRFGALAPIASDMRTWCDGLRALADTGYSTILLPDVPGWHPDPAPALAVAATVTDLRVGTWVYASPVRPPWITAWEAHSLSAVTEGRFEMGIGTGRPGIGDQLRELGLADTPVGERAAQIRQIITTLRDLDGADLHTPVAMAVGGPKAQAVAAELADIVTFVMPQTESRADTARRIEQFDNRRDLELAVHVPVVGDRVAYFMAGPDADPAEIRTADSVSYLPADPDAAAEEILRRREELGFSYFVVGADVAVSLAPAVARLAGQS